MSLYCYKGVTTMRVEGRKVYLKPEEVSTECPVKPAWAARMIEVYGPDAELRGRLGRFSRCPEVLDLAGYEVEIEGSQGKATPKAEAEQAPEAEVKAAGAELRPGKSE